MPRSPAACPQIFLVNGLGIKTWVGPRLTLSFLAHCPVTFPPYTLCHCHLPPPQRPNQWTAQFWSWTSKAVSLINPYSVITSLSQVFGCSSEKLINAVNNGSFAFLLPLLTIFPFLIGLRLLVQCWITITAGLYVYKMIYYFIYLKGWGLERDRKPPPSWFTPQMSADLGVGQAKAGSTEINLGLLGSGRDPTTSAITRSLTGCIWAGSWNSGWNRVSNPGSQIWGGVSQVAS